MFDHKVLWLFIIGTILSILFYIEERLSNTEDKIKNIKVFLLLALINGVLGGFIMVVVFYGLAQYYPEWNDYIRIGVAGGIATMGKDAFKLFHKRFQKVGGK